MTNIIFAIILYLILLFYYPFITITITILLIILIVLYQKHENKKQKELERKFYNNEMSEDERSEYILSLKKQEDRKKQKIEEIENKKLNEMNQKQKEKFTEIWEQTKKENPNAKKMSISMNFDENGEMIDYSTDIINQNFDDDFYDF